MVFGQRIDSMEYIQSKNSSENADFVDEILFEILENCSNAVQTDSLEEEEDC